MTNNFFSKSMALALLAFSGTAAGPRSSHAGICDWFLGNITKQAENFIAPLEGTYKIIEARDIEVYNSNGRKLSTSQMADDYRGALVSLSFEQRNVRIKRADGVRFPTLFGDGGYFEFDERVSKYTRTAVEAFVRIISDKILIKRSVRKHTLTYERTITSRPRRAGAWTTRPEKKLHITALKDGSLEITTVLTSPYFTAVTLKLVKVNASLAQR